MSSTKIFLTASQIEFLFDLIRRGEGNQSIHWIDPMGPGDYDHRSKIGLKRTQANQIIDNPTEHLGHKKSLFYEKYVCGFLIQLGRFGILLDILSYNFDISSTSFL